MANRPNWYSRHPPACTCVRCARRQRRRGGTFRFRRYDSRHALKTIVIAVAVVYALITIFHLSKGFNLDAALVGGLVDARAVAICWGEWEGLWEFFSRPSLSGRDIGPIALEMGDCQRM